MTVSSGVMEANCTAQSRPAAEITWDMGGDNRTLGPPILSSYDQGDGTTVVTSTLLLPSVLLSELSIKCVVHHQGVPRPLTVTLGKNGKASSSPFITFRFLLEKTLTLVLSSLFCAPSVA